MPARHLAPADFRQDGDGKQQDDAYFRGDGQRFRKKTVQKKGIAEERQEKNQIK